MLRLNDILLISLVMNSQPKIHVLSNNSLLLDASHLSHNTLAIQEKIWALVNFCTKTNDFVDLVPAMNSLTLYLKSAHNLNKWRHALPQYWHDIKADSFVGKHHLIKTTYNGDDLTYVANYHNLSIQDVINIHSKARYFVLFLGFQPGFAYLYGLDTRLHTPRRSEPRIKVPKGAVAIGAEQTGIYPADTPGGWHIIGHTKTALFDSTDSQPCLIQPGDTIEFVDINKGGHS